MDDMDRRDITGAFEEFLRDYYRDSLGQLAGVYPHEKTLRVDYADLWAFNSDLADDFRNRPDDITECIQDAIPAVDLPVDVTLSDVNVRVTGLNDEHVYAPGEIRHEHGGQYIGVSGVIERVTTTSDLPAELTFECLQCGSRVTVPQSPTQDDIQQPINCSPHDNSGHQGPFDIVDSASEWTDYVRVRVDSRHDTTPELSGKIPAYAMGEMVDRGGENGLLGRAGENATVYGVVRRVQKSGRGENKMLFDHVLEIKAIEFDTDEDTVDVDAHREEFERIAGRDDAVELWKQSLAPELFATDAWQAALELGVAYLFGAPGLDIPDGPTYRGDIHAMLITGYGMGKSTFNEGVNKYSPKCISKSATGLSSDVGLLAAAVKDDFGDGQWTIKPGILVRGNGGHVILDEIDKPDVELARMNDALEGTQQIDIEKAGQSATYQSKVGLLATGNPEDSRFDPQVPVADQMGIDETLLSRFDGIVTMRDTADVETDAKIAERIIDGIVEASEYVDSERNEFDVLERPVPVDVGRAWIQHARENVRPVARKEQLEEIAEWYAEEVRQLNNTYAGDSGEGADMPVPATARVVENVYRFSAAFARLHLREEIADEDVARAKELSKQLISQNWNGEEFVPVHSQSQKDEYDRIKDAMRGRAEPVTKEQVANVTEIDESTVEHKVEKLLQKGEVSEPRTGYYRVV